MPKTRPDSNESIKDSKSTVVNSNRSFSKPKKNFRSPDKNFSNKRSFRHNATARPRNTSEVLANYNPNRHLRDRLDDATYIVFDLETTGGNPERNCITEISALKVKNGQIIETFYSLVNPKRGIPRIVQEMTGITPQMVKKAPDIFVAMPQFLGFVGDNLLVSHNTIGDLKFVTYYADLVCRFRFENFFVCTHLQSEKCIPESPDHSLKGLAQFFNWPIERSHRAEDDALLTLNLLNEIISRLKKSGVETILQAIRIQGDFDSAVRLGWDIAPQYVQQSPQQPGLFHLKDYNNQTLFFSSSFNLKRDLRKLQSIFDIPRQLLKKIVKSSNLESKVFTNIFSAMLEEAKLLGDEHLSYSPLRWHARYINMISMKENEQGQIVLTIGYCEPDSSDNFGPISDQKKFSQFFEVIASQLGGEATNKKLVLDGKFKKYISSWLNNAILEEEKKYKKQSSSLLNWILPTKRKEYRKQLELFKVFKEAQLEDNFKSLRQINGYLVFKGSGFAAKALQNSKKENKATTETPYTIYKIQDSIVTGMTKESDADKFIKSDTWNQESSVGPISKEQAYQMNAVLWFYDFAIRKKRIIHKKNEDTCYFVEMPSSK